MLKRLVNFAKEPTSINILINSIGNYLNVGFIAFFALILVRTMPPAEYGVLTVLLGIAYVLANIMEFGTTATIYSAVPGLYAHDDKRLYTFIKSTFFYQTLFSAIIIIVLTFTFPYLDKIFFKTGAPPITLYLTAFSVLFYVWQNFLTNILLAANKFFRSNLYLNTANVVKTLLIVGLAYFGTITISNVIIIFGMVGPLVYFLMLLAKNRKLIPKLEVAKIDKKEFQFSYTMMYFAASQFYNMGIRMDLFLLSFFGLRDEVGYYGLSQKIILSIIATIVSISQVLSPQFATVENKAQLKKMLKKGMLYMMIPAGIFIALFLTPQAVFDLVFTAEYGPAAGAAHALALPFVLNAFGTVFMIFILYTVKKPVYILWSNIALFIIITVGSYILIPTKGMFGPPIAIAAAFVVANAILLYASVKEYRSLPNIRT